METPTSPKNVPTKTGKAKTIVTTVVFTLIAVVGLGVAGTLAHGPHGPGGYGPGGYGPGYGMKHHGQGFGPGMSYGMKQGKFGRGACITGQTLDTPLTVDDVRTNLEQRLQFRGNDRLKVGSVTDKDDKTIAAEIVTIDDSLVRKIEVDKATGRHTPVN